MASGVAPDFSNQPKVTFKSPPAGSCITQAFLDELASLLVVESAGDNVQNGPCLSQQSNNLASLDSTNCFFVPSVVRYEDQQDALAPGPTNLFFSGWPAELDATVAQLEVTPIFAPADFTTGRCWVVSRTATAIAINVSGNSANAVVQLKLTQFPVPPVQS